MMKKILIIPASESGHIIPTFKIAKILQENGYSVTYLVSANMKSLVLEQGFEVSLCHTMLFANHTFLGIFDQPDKKIMDRILDRISNSTLNATIQNLLKFENAIEKIAPDEILLDVFLSYNYILLKNKRPTTFIQTMVSTYQDALVSPLSKNAWSSNKLLIKLDWWRYKLARQGRRIAYLGDGQWDLTKRALKKLNRIFDFSLLNWDKCFHVGIKNIPEWVLSPEAFDFPREKKLPFQHYIASTIDLNRVEVYPPHYTELMQRIQGKRIAYCSLGTISLTANKNAADFLKKVATVFMSKNDWALIISCGQVDINKFGIVASNIHLFQRVPQLDVLKRSEIVITSSGHNTITECILLGVPMLVFPLSNKWDQNGNAVRVEYHKLGLKGNINTVTVAELKAKIERLIENPMFKENIFKMSTVFQKQRVTLTPALLNIKATEFV
jgi:zeaxanthin glucosyltransferase